LADNVAVTAGSGTTIGTDERSINSVTVQVQRVDEQGSTAIDAAQTNVTNSAATLVAARDTRKRVVIVNRQVAAIFVGEATVTTANGFQIDPGASLTLYTTALIQAITAAASGGTEKVHTIEEYDTV
jgi:hypothetical protein